jgi:hydroxyacylglutathione hydrolase
MPDKTSYSIHSMELGPMENFVYLVHDHATNRAAIVDPAWEVDLLLSYARERDILISDILLTHSHHDHVNGIETVLAQYDAEVHLLKAEAQFWGASLVKPKLHNGGDLIQIGNSEIEIMHTPGHTPGSACYHTHDHLIAGDTLFVFGCGRCDLRGGDPEQMFTTLRHIRTHLPEETIVLPGHNYSPSHPSSSLHEQYEGNPFLHMETEQDFVRYRMQIHDRIRDTPYESVSKAEALSSLI